MELEELHKLFFKLHTFLSLILVIYIVLSWKKLNKELIFFYYYCLSSFLLLLFLQSINPFYDLFYEDIILGLGIKNMSTFDYFFFLRNFLLLGLFYSLLLAPRKIGKWIRYIGVGLAIACTINYLFIEGYKGFGVFNPTVDAIFCFVVPLIYCRVMFQQDDDIPLSKNPYFWITIGQLQVALIGFFLFFTEDFIIKSDPELFNKLAVGRNVLMIIEQIMYAIAFYYAKNTRYLNVTMSDGE